MTGEQVPAPDLDYFYQNQTIQGERRPDYRLPASYGRTPSPYVRMLEIPRNMWIVTAHMVRDLWKDFPQFQEIFRYSQVVTDFDYDKAIVRSIMDYNDELPAETYTPANFPDTRLLLWKAHAEILNVYIGYHSSNMWTGSSGGVTNPVHERYQALIAMKNDLENKILPRQARRKEWVNEQAAYGGFNRSLGFAWVYPTGSFFGYSVGARGNRG